MKSYQPLGEKETRLSKQIVDIAYSIHKALGPGLLESIYQKCFCLDLIARNIPFVQQQLIDVCYQNTVIEDILKLDLLVDDVIIIEIKAQDNFHPVWEAQLLSYLKLTGKRLGYLINFHTPLLKDGIKRMIL